MVDFSSGEPWPFDDDSVDELRSSHLIEHIPSMDACEWVRGREKLIDPGHAWERRHETFKDLLFHFFDEAFRVIKPGGKFEVRWPALINERTGEMNLTAFQDPTHRRFIPLKTFHYFSRSGREALGVAQYNVTCNWVMESRVQAAAGDGGHDDFLEYRAVLRAEK